MMQFIETLYADPLLKFLVNTTIKSFVIFAGAGLFACCLRGKSAAMRGFVWNMATVQIDENVEIGREKDVEGLVNRFKSVMRPVRNYLNENNIPWRQIFSGQKWNSPLAQKYHIRSIPAPWLIDRDGTLISREARGVKLERLVVKALRDKIKSQ